MPIYEYQCDDCGHQFEAIQKMSDEALTQCPNCHQASLRKLVSAAAFRLKGKGWYETDFKDSNKKNLSASESKPSNDKKPAEKSASQSGGKTTSTKAAKPGKSSGGESGG